jgi:hypothetical protein
MGSGNPDSAFGFIARLVQLNRLPLAEKKEIYGLLIPRSLLARFGVNPETGLNRLGERVITIECPERGAEASVEVKSRPTDRDPIFYIEVSDSRDLIQLEWDFIMINDPESPRFDTDVTPEGKDRWLNWTSRNRPEEEKALAAGLAPGQVRRGLGLTEELLGSLDQFCQALGQKSIFLEALFYHNAILYERHGFRYFEGEPQMRRIQELFQPGGKLWARLDGSTFRRPEFAQTVRGRSWAIHDGILNDLEDEILKAWTPPKLYRMVGKRFQVETFPGARW